MSKTFRRSHSNFSVGLALTTNETRTYARANILEEVDHPERVQEEPIPLAAQKWGGRRSAAKRQGIVSVSINARSDSESP